MGTISFSQVLTVSETTMHFTKTKTKVETSVDEKFPLQNSFIIFLKTSQGEIHIKISVLFDCH